MAIKSGTLNPLCWAIVIIPGHLLPRSDTLISFAWWLIYGRFGRTYATAIMWWKLKWKFWAQSRKKICVCAWGCWCANVNHIEKVWIGRCDVKRGHKAGAYLWAVKGTGCHILGTTFQRNSFSASVQHTREERNISFGNEQKSKLKTLEPRTARTEV